jgi:hypothetical protein
MKKATMLVVACVALGSLVVAGSAGAAAYNAPKQAKKMSIEMVTAVNQCTAPTLTHRPSLALPSCAPVVSTDNNPIHSYTFSDHVGSASVSLQAAKGDVKLGAKSKSVLKNGSPYSGNDLQATATIRTTDNGCGPLFDTDCTIVDFPFPVGLTCTNGSCKAATATANATLPGAVHAGDNANIQIGAVTILDEDGDGVARGGLYVA